MGTTEHNEAALRPAKVPQIFGDYNSTISEQARTLRVTLYLASRTTILRLR
jgi:hypothetical protein